MPFLLPGDRGRYTSTEEGLRTETRIDPATDGFLISGDVLMDDPQLTPRLSFFTPFPMDGELERRVPPDTSPPWPVTVVDPEGGQASGELELVRSGDPGPGPGNVWRQNLVLAGPVGGFPAGQRLNSVIAWQGRELRVLAVEVLQEDDVDVPACVVVGGQNQGAGSAPADETPDVTRCLAAAGIAIVTDTTAEPGRIPRALKRWDASAVYDILRGPSTTSLSRLDVPGWRTQLLLLSRASDPDLLGIAIDGPHLPRQAAVVFVDAIRAGDAEGAADDLFERRCTQVVTHELGHCVQLQHSFDRQVRRSRSHSHMNYEWKFPGAEEDLYAFWRAYEFTFDEEELRFLWHADWRKVTPGASEFGFAQYWSPAPAKTSSRYDDLTLWLTGPGNGAATFTEGQPITLSVGLRNDGSRPVRLPRRVLDVKSAQFDVEIEKRTADTAGVNAARTFVPTIRRCQVTGPGASILLAPGDSLDNNLVLVDGADQQSFLRPGKYRVTPFLSFPPESEADGELDDVVSGRWVDFVVKPAVPALPDADLSALATDREVRMVMALGGAGTLHDAEARLESIRTRRGEDPRDPLVAAISRTLGISAGRQEQQLDRAVRELETAVAGAEAFDPVTREQTARLLQRRYADRAERDGQRPRPAPVVVVDLRLRGSDGQTYSGGRVIGIPRVRRRPDGRTEMFEIFAPADHLDAGVLAPADPEVQAGDAIGGDADENTPTALADGIEVVADVMVTADDGLSERVGVRWIRLVADRGGGPFLAAIRLSRTVPMDAAADPATFTSLEQVPDDAPDWDALGTQGFGEHELMTLRDDDLARWTAGADGNLANLDAQARAQSRPVPERLRPPVFGTDAFRVARKKKKPWYCPLIRVCNSGYPGAGWYCPGDHPGQCPGDCPDPPELVQAGPAPALILDALADVPSRWAYSRDESREESSEQDGSESTDPAVQSGSRGPARKDAPRPRPGGG